MGINCHLEGLFIDNYFYLRSYIMNMEVNKNFSMDEIEGFLEEKGVKTISIYGRLRNLKDRIKILYFNGKAIVGQDEGDLISYMDRDLPIKERDDIRQDILKISLSHLNYFKALGKDEWVCISTNDLFIREEVKRFKGYSDEAILYNSWYKDTTPLIYEKRRDVEVKTIPMDEWEIVFKTYTHSGDNPNYIKSLIKNKALIGAYIGGKLAGYVGTHYEGCMGLLEVFPEYRQEGIGKYLVNELLQRKRDAKLLSYGHVESFNQLAKGMYERMGFTLDDSLTYWLFFNN